MKQKLIIRTRSGSLALWQAEYIKGLIQVNHSELEIELKHIKTTKGYGKRKPIATNDTDFGRQLNRRTEIVIVAK